MNFDGVKFTTELNTFHVEAYDQYLAEITPSGYIIMEGARNQLHDDLIIMINYLISQAYTKKIQEYDVEEVVLTQLTESTKYEIERDW